jgi:hypothetical protein
MRDETFYLNILDLFHEKDASFVGITKRGGIKEKFLFNHGRVGFPDKKTSFITIVK